MDPSIALIDFDHSVDLSDLMPLTKLWVLTTHSLYQFVVRKDADVLVQGGTFLPDPASADLVGARFGHRWLKVGWIEVGLPMEIGIGDRHIVTSPVHAIVAEPPVSPTVH